MRRIAGSQAMGAAAVFTMPMEAARDLVRGDGGPAEVRERARRDPQVDQVGSRTGHCGVEHLGETSEFVADGGRTVAADEGDPPEVAPGETVT